MKSATNNANHTRRTRGIRSTILFRTVTLTFLAFLAIMLAMPGGTFATGSVVGVPQAQATVPATTGPALSSGTASTSNAPGAVQSAVPNAQNTAQSPRAVPSVGTGGTTTKPGGTSDGGFPWLPVALGALVVAAIAGFALMRPRRVPEVVATTPSTPNPGNRGTAYAVTTAPSATSPAAQSVATTSVVTSVPTAAAAPPSTVTCPNCDTVNDFKENFCKECGQDLRPTRSALLAALAPPPELVTDDMPYLETLDRSDEQLEYVLSRPRVLLGTASNSDIVIDSAFNGSQSVSPTHAELRREQEGYLLVDRGSQNGTFVNDARTGESILSDGDTIRIGDVRFIFHIPTAGE